MSGSLLAVDRQKSQERENLGNAKVPHIWSNYDPLGGAWLRLRLRWSRWEYRTATYLCTICATTLLPAWTGWIGTPNRASRGVFAEKKRSFVGRSPLPLKNIRFRFVLCPTITYNNL